MIGLNQSKDLTRLRGVTTGTQGNPEALFGKTWGSLQKGQ